MQKMTVGRYLILRLEEIGLEHMFGVPGDYVLDFMDRVVESPIHLIGNCNELNAGYAAEAYARLAPGIWHQTMRGPYNDVYSY